MIDVGALYETHWPAVLGYMRRRVRGEDEAVLEDLAADVFLRAVAAADRWEDRGVSPEAWLMRIAANLVIDYYRRRRAPHAQLDALANSPRHAATDAGNDLHVSFLDLHDALDSLSPAQQRLVDARFARGLPWQEVGYEIGSSGMVVKHLWSREVQPSVRRKLEVA